MLASSNNQIPWEFAKSALRKNVRTLLRHEAISRLFEETDLDVMEIRAISGHKTLQMLARYTHLRTYRLADRLAGMGRTGQSH